MLKYLEEQKEFEVEIAKDLILVDFYADWCGPCKMLGNILEQVEFVDVLKVNVDQFPELAQKFGIMSIPTICFFSKSNLLRKEIGFKSLEELGKIVEEIKKEIE